jgi:hypothetical protein
MKTYTCYLETNRFDQRVIDKVKQVFGEEPKIVGTEGIYTIYTIEAPEELTTSDQKWAMGATREEMIAAGLIEGQVAEWTPDQGLKVRPAALKDPSIIDKRPIKWDDLTQDTKDLLSR